MAIPVSGPLSFNTLNTEVGIASDTMISINDPVVRDLTGNASGQTSLSAVYGTTFPMGFYGSVSLGMTARQGSANTYTYVIFQLNTNGTVGIDWGASEIAYNAPTGFHNPTTVGITTRYQYRIQQTGFSNPGGIGIWGWAQSVNGGGTILSGSASGGNFDSGWLGFSGGYQTWRFHQQAVSIALGADATATGDILLRRIGQLTVTRSIPFSLRIRYSL
jgi:hypothetical protein